MTKQEIQEYVAHTPYNTNPAIVGSMIDELGGGGSDIPVITITADTYTKTFTCDKTIAEINDIASDAWDGKPYIINIEDTGTTMSGQISLAYYYDDYVIFNMMGSAWFVLTTEEGGVIMPMQFTYFSGSFDLGDIEQMRFLNDEGCQYEIQAKNHSYAFVNDDGDTLTFIGAGASSDPDDYYLLEIDAATGAVTYVGLDVAR